MDYTNYLSILYDYEKKDVGSEEKSILFKVINSVDLSAQNRILFEIKRQESDRWYFSYVKITGTQTSFRKKGIDIKGHKKISINQYWVILCPYRDQSISPKSLEKV